MNRSIYGVSWPGHPKGTHSVASEGLRNEIIRFLNTVVRPGQDVSQVSDDTNLVDAGVIDSLALIQIIFFLESEHGVQLHTAGVDPADLVSVAGILSTLHPDQK